MSFKGYDISVKGASHIARDMACQDHSGNFCCDDYCVAIVSDGHGGERHFRSGDGAEKAVNIALEAVKEFILCEKDYLPEMAGRYKTVLKQLAGCISARWSDAVIDHFNNNPITEFEQDIYDKYYSGVNDGADPNITAMYGATLIIGVITASYAFAIQTGDGACVVMQQDGNCFIPPETIDDRLFLGYTTSLCDLNALDNFRYYYDQDAPKAIVLSSDGVVDSYGKNEFIKFILALCDLFYENYEEALSHLSDWLPKLSARGSKDDMTVAGIYCSE